MNNDQKTYWQIFQQEKYGNVIEQQGGAELENGKHEAEAFEYWMRCGEESLLRELEDAI